MSRLITSTWDDDTAQGWTNVDTGWNDVTAELPYSGPFGITCINSGNPFQRNWGSGLSEFYFRVFLRWTATRNSSQPQPMQLLAPNALFTMMRLKMNRDNGLDGPVGQLAVEIGAGTFTSGAFVLAPNTWYRVEVYGLISATGKYIVRVDGVDRIDSGVVDTRDGGWTAVQYLSLDGFGDFGENSYYDEFALNDTAGGAPDNTWPGGLATGPPKFSIERLLLSPMEGVY